MNVIKDSMYLLLSTLIATILMFISQVLVSRNYSIEEYGLYVSVFNFMNLFSIFITFGSNEYLLKIFGSEGDRAYSKIKKLMIIWIFMSLFTVLFIGIILIIMDFPEITKHLLLLTIPHLFMQGILPVILSIYQLERNFLKVSIINLSIYFVRFLPILIGSENNKSLDIVFFWISLLSSFILIFYIISLLKLNKRSLRLPNEDHDHSQNIIFINSYSKILLGIFPYGSLLILYYLFYQSNILVLIYFESSESVGIFNSAFVIVSLFFLFPQIIVGKLFLPKIHNWIHHDYMKIKKLYINGNIFFTVIGIFFGLLIYVFSKDIILFIFGEKYLESNIILKLLSITIPFRYIQSISGAIMNTGERINDKLKIMFYISIFIIFINIILVYKIGLIGIVIGTLMAEILLTLYMVKGARKYIKNISNLLEVKSV